MKKTEFKIPIYDFDVTIIEVESKEDKAEVNTILSNFGLEKEGIDEALSCIEDGSINGGITFHDLPYRKFVVVLYPFKDIEDKILKYCGITDLEASAYLAGYISKFMY